VVYILSLTIRVYLPSFSRCWLPSVRNHTKFWEKSDLQKFKVIQGHRSRCQYKGQMELPIRD